MRGMSHHMLTLKIVGDRILRFPLPDVPKGWTPNPKQVWERATADDTNKENAATGASSQVQTHAQWKIGITPDEVCRCTAHLFHRLIYA